MLEEFKPWMQEITLDDLPNDDLKFVGEVAGLKLVLALIFCCSGLTVSIPKDAFKAVKDRYIIRHYDGTKFSLNKLATDCDVSQKYIYDLLKKSRKINLEYPNN